LETSLTESRTSSAVDGIRSMIVSGALRPGDRLPPEAELAERLHLSRSSLRETVRALTFIGVLRTRQGDGTYVTELDGASLLDNLGFVVDLASEHTLVEFFQLRRMLEPAATGLAAARITDEDLAEIETQIDAMAAAAASAEQDAFIDADLAFHHRITDVAGNAVLSSLLRGLALRAVRAHRWRARADSGAIDRSLEEHRAIFYALRSRDPEAAQAVATAHLLAGEAWMRGVVEGAVPPIAEDGSAKEPT
jgi:DNA-binding FadR family transcriptional regulator